MRRRTAMAAVATFVAFLAVLLSTRIGHQWFDLSGHAFAVHHRTVSSARLARTLTQGGSTRIVWPLIVVSAFAFGRGGPIRRLVTAAFVIGGCGCAIWARLLISDVVRRPRPPLFDWAGTAGGFAFPSGHTTAATLGAGMLAWALTRHLTGRRAHVAVWIIAAGYALTVGLTRWWLGVHWPTDVLGGWLFASSWLLTMRSIELLLPRRRERSVSPRAVDEQAGIEMQRHPS